MFLMSGPELEDGRRTGGVGGVSNPKRLFKTMCHGNFFEGGSNFTLRMLKFFRRVVRGSRG